MSCETYTDITIAVGRSWADSFIISNTDSSGNITTVADLTGKTVSASLVTSTLTIQLANGAGIAITTPTAGLITVTLTIAQLATLVIGDRVVLQFTVWNADGSEFAPVNYTYTVRAG